MSACKIILLSLFLMSSCSSMKKNERAVKSKESENHSVISNVTDGPQTIIYKTRGDYRKLVPVTLSDDKSKIISYPHPGDVYYKDQLATPVELKGGYLLDNMGINSNVAFLGISYDEYSKLQEAPAVDELLRMITDKEPLTEIYNCGNRYTFKNEVSDLNKLIESNGLKNCKYLTKE